MAETECFLCKRLETPVEAWQLDSLKFIYEGWVEKKLPCLCAMHQKFCVDRIAELKKKVYELKTGEPVYAKTFVPAIPAKPIRNWQDREPGSDDE